MAIIHHTTMTPTKLELLTTWLPGRPWYRGAGSAPELARTGGFRLDDPAGEVGMEFMVVSDGATAYHVPLTYRGAPLAGAEHTLVGTSEHGVLGTRWIYDGTHDPLLVRQLVALLAGETEAQAQSVSDTPDPTVTVDRADPGLSTAGLTVGAVTDGAEATDIDLGPGPLTLRVHRVLTPATAATRPLAQVTAPWQPPTATQPRALFATLR
ncbi:1,4-alpha-glucan branching protein [Streptomyces sp. B6B3]|uniref:maltokinase N-terminal cap-like domain-containing protein n=1 Tax=Streptomyces sp. B6B3 TaxID=3153570 RepID=UPI00325CB7AD